MARRNYTEEELSDLRGRVPMGRLAETEDVSRAVLFLASDLNSYITGQSLIVDGGFSVA
jgi:3-oxoacyl-[acyl-carrier protein] reductase